MNNKTINEIKTQNKKNKKMEKRNKRTSDNRKEKWP
jgi:hypothetical protein